MTPSTVKFSKMQLMLQFHAYCLHNSTYLVNKKPYSLLLQNLPSTTTGDFSLWLWGRDSRSRTGESHFTASYLESLPRTILQHSRYLLRGHCGLEYSVPLVQSESY